MIDFRARDGSIIDEVVKFQVCNLEKGIPIVLSAGGNDLLKHLDNITTEDKKTYNQFIQSLKPILNKFYISYNALLNKLEYPALCFTIYNPAFKYFYNLENLYSYQTSCEITLNIFNDAIQSQVKKRGFDLLELRDLMIEKSDYSNPIEPSHVGGKKIAKAIFHWLENIKLNSNY